MSDMKWTMLIVMTLLLSVPVVAQKTDEPPVLDQAPTPTEVITSEKMTMLSYTYVSMGNFEYQDVEDDGDYAGDSMEFSGGGLHTLGVSWKREDGGGTLISFGFSDQLNSESTGPLSSGYGSIDATLQRYEFDITGFGAGKGPIHSEVGFKYIQTAIQYDYAAFSGDVLSQSFEVKNHYLGLLLGIGGNHPLSKDRCLLSLYWSVQLLGLYGWRDADDLQYVDYGYYWDYDYEEEEYGPDAFFAGGLNGAAGVQIHLGNNFTFGVGYKGQYLTGQYTKESFNGLMALAMIRI